MQIKLCKNYPKLQIVVGKIALERKRLYQFVLRIKMMIRIRYSTR
jgi:hypothetical protein